MMPPPTLFVFLVGWVGGWRGWVVRGFAGGGDASKRGELAIAMVLAWLPTTYTTTRSSVVAAVVAILIERAGTPNVNARAPCAWVPRRNSTSRGRSRSSCCVALGIIRRRGRCRCPTDVMMLVEQAAAPTGPQHIRLFLWGGCQEWLC